MRNTPYVNSSFLNEFPELVVSRRGDLQHLCHLSGIAKEAMIGSHRLIPFEQFINLLEVSAVELKLPQIALELAQRQDVSILGPISLMLSDCKTFAEVLEQIINYISLIASGIEAKLVIGNNTAEIHYHVSLPNLYHRPQFQNYLLASTALLMHELMGKKSALRGCFFTRFENDKTLQRQFSLFFGCPVVFAADQLKLTVDKTVLDYPADSVDQVLIRRMNALLHSPIGVVRHLEKVLTLMLASGNININTVAKSMGYSGRTLHRRLAEENTSFRSILDGVRFTQANQYLRNSHYSLHDIALLLGYKNQSAFSRSYMRWSGVKPKTVRDQLNTSAVKR